MIGIHSNPIECDVLVVGGGIGGLMAAISAADQGVKVVIAEKANTKRSGSGSTGNDHFQCYIPEIHGEDMGPILREMNECLTGGYLDQDLTVLFLKESFDRVQDWEKWGINMRPHGIWEFNGHAMPGRPRIFLKYAGANQKSVLTREALKRGVTIYNKLPISEIITNDSGAVTGAIGISIEKEEPELRVFRAKNVILTTGTANRLYSPKTGGMMFNLGFCPSCTGTGRSAAYRAGAKLVNLDIPNTHAGPKFFNRCGKATWIGVLKDYEGKPIGPFVTKPSKELGDITADIWHGVFGIKNKAGEPVYMDCSETSEEDVQYMLWGLEQEGDTSLLNYMQDEGIDVRKHMVEFTTYEPFLIGRGIEINEKAETNIKGLYAAGDEVGNFRADIAGAATFGWIAGKSAAERAQDLRTFEPAEESVLVEEKRRFYSELLSREAGTANPSWQEVNIALQQIMTDYAGIEVRSEHFFMAGLKYLNDLKGKAINTMYCQNSHELMRCLEVLDLIQLGELIMLTARERKETRGKHIRVDYPFTNPLNTNRFITIRQAAGMPEIKWRDRRDRGAVPFSHQENGTKETSDCHVKGKIPGESTGITIKKSICTICDPLTQCGLNLYMKDDKIIKVEGSKENPKNEGTLCSKGAATRQYVYHPDRIKTPLKRIGPKGSEEFIPVSWDEALDTIAERLNGYKNKFGPESVAFFCGYTKWLRPFLQRLAYSFGSPNYMTESSTCGQATHMAQKLNFGTPARPDIEKTNCLLVWSANPFHSNTTLVRKILAAKDRGMKIITVDPRYTPMAAQADLHLQLKPGTDGALALTMANVIIKEGLYDHDFIDKFTLGFQEFAQYVQEFTPEKGEGITGVKAEKIIQAARHYAKTKPAAIMQSAAPVVHNTNGVQNYRAVFSLIALTGNYDIAGGNFVDPPSFAGVSAGIETRENEFAHPKKFEEMAPRVGQDRFPVWSELVDQAQAMGLPDQINSGRPYPIKAMLAFGINHRMWPNSKNMLEALKKLDFYVDVDIFMTQTAKYADLILPACSSVERSELRCYQERYIIYTQPAIQPLYKSRSDADIIFDLGQRLMLDDPLINAGHEASLDYILEPSGITIKELKKYPAGLPVPNPVKIPEKKYLAKGFATPSGKMEFKSLVLEKYAHDYDYDALPVYHPPKHSVENTPNLAKKYPLILNTGSRLPMFLHSRTFRLPWINSLRPEAMADMNPIDAQRLNITQGDPIRISTPPGEIRVKANLTLLVQPGVVHMYHAYPDADVNTLFDSDYLDPISGFPGFKALLCKVEKAESNQAIL